MYEELMKKLGFPDSFLLRKILEYLMDEKEAKIVAFLPASIEELAKKFSIEKEKVEKILENLFRKGVVIPRDFKNRDYYRFVRDIVQLHDATLASKHMKDPEFAKLWKEFGEKEAHKAVGNFLSLSGIKVWRVVPAYNAIKDLPDVLPYENIVEMIKAQEKIALVPCSCRNVTSLAASGCKFTKELVNDEKTWHCIQLGRGAEYVIERGSGIEISVDEALELIERIEKDGLVHTWVNTAKIVDKRVTVNCNCCSDCCEFFLAAKFSGIPISSILEKSRYVAYVEKDVCIACGTCVERCHFNAIALNSYAKVDEEKCFGCGVCVVGCEQGAMKMKVVRGKEHIPLI
ncbi:MAG: 4Fe-4S binding protein [Archaeoglobaceae archaeon]|nr:4Fe-4S binding protein [Archaeoglobaceae archaeon]MCX8152799.1 4Fe-4S binding protein [Archaeoglobaceae archaeon]MDW8013506.1 4Fe-4S binding protein [Archaeoglobaceae archaeon]